MLIGITGTIGAGKGAVVEYLVQQKKFTHISARSIWTLELEARKLPVNRDTMTVLANQMRAEHGADYFVTRALEEVSGSQDTVIESIRTVAELELLHKQDATILAVDAPEQLRYQRVHGRGSALDDITFKDFVRQEKAEMSNTDPAKQNLSKVMKMADYTILNEGSLEELHTQIEEVLQKI